MVTSAIKTFTQKVDWKDLDFIIVDMPPGTGDIHLTLSQKAPVSGAVIVTTPQDIALLDAMKGIEMFAKVDIPVLGIVENMSVHQCPRCGHISHLFGADGGRRVAEDLSVPLLGQLPLAMSIREQADGGQPTVKVEPDSKISALYRDAARKMAAQLWGRKSPAAAGPAISMVDD